MLASRTNGSHAGENTCELLADLTGTAGNATKPAVVGIKFDLNALTVAVIQARLHASGRVAPKDALPAATIPTGYAAYAAPAAVGLITPEIPAAASIPAEGVARLTGRDRCTHSRAAELLRGA